jgi:hypothetical protein
VDVVSEDLSRAATSSVRAATDPVFSRAPLTIHKTMPPPERAPIADAINTTRKVPRKFPRGARKPHSG